MRQDRTTNNDDELFFRFFSSWSLVKSDSLPRTYSLPIIPFRIPLKSNHHPNGKWTLCRGILRMGPLLSTEKLEKEIRMSISQILPFYLGRIQFRYKASRRSWLIQRSLRGGLYASCGKAGLMVYVTAGLISRYQQQNSARVEHVMNVGASSNLHAIRKLRYIFVWPCVGNHLDSQPDQKKLA